MFKIISKMIDYLSNFTMTNNQSSIELLMEDLDNFNDYAKYEVSK